MSANDQVRVWAIGGREGWRLSADFVCSGVPYDFAGTSPQQYYYIHDFSFSSFNSLRYSWTTDYFAAMELELRRNNWTDAERALCASRLVDYIVMHIPTIIARMRVANRWNAAWERTLTPEYVRWLLSPSNILKKRGNTAAHEMKRSDVVIALRRSIAQVVDATDKLYVGHTADLLSSAT